jgi:hypothetical protein
MSTPSRTALPSTRKRQHDVATKRDLEMNNQARDARRALHEILRPSVSRTIRIACALGIGGVILIVVGALLGRPDVDVEGAYFQRSPLSHSGVFSFRGPGLLSPSDGNLWIGAGIAVLVAVAVLAVRVQRSRRR